MLSSRIGVFTFLYTSVLPVQECLPILVELELRDHNLGRVDANGHGLTVGLVPGDSFNMNAPLLAVDLCHLALTVVKMATNNHNLVIPSDWQRANTVLCAEVLAERRTHQLATDVRGRCKVGLARLATRHADCGLLLHRQSRAASSTNRGKVP